MIPYIFKADFGKEEEEEVTDVVAALGADFLELPGPGTKEADCRMDYGWTQQLGRGRQRAGGGVS